MGNIDGCEIAHSIGVRHHEVKRELEANRKAIGEKEAHARGSIESELQIIFVIPSSSSDLCCDSRTAVDMDTRIDEPANFHVRREGRCEEAALKAREATGEREVGDADRNHRVECPSELDPELQKAGGGITDDEWPWIALEGRKACDGSTSSEKKRNMGVSLRGQSPRAAWSP